MNALSVTPRFNLQGVGEFQRSADWKSAIQQAESLRYVAPTVQHLRGVEYAGEAVDALGRVSSTPLKRGVNERTEFLRGAFALLSNQELTLSSN